MRNLVRAAGARLTLRARLALLYLTLFAAAGAGLLLLINVLVRRQLAKPTVEALDAGELPPPAAATVPSADLLSSADQAARENAMRIVSAQSGIAVAAVTVVASALCWWLAGRALRPLSDITSTAGRLSQDTLDDRIGLTGPRDEVRALADAFDAMMDRLAQAFTAQRLFVANASHELRAPLTVIRTAVDVGLMAASRPEADYRRALATIADAAQRSEQLLDGLLQLARTQDRPDRLERLDLADLLSRAVESLPAGGPEPRLELAPASLRGQRILLELLVRNVLDNAVRYNVPGGWVRVRTERGADDVTLRVENTGRRIPPEQVAQLPRPFHRGDHSRIEAGEGFGLGLAIVDAVAEAHGGRCDLAARPDGGLTVTVVLPADTSRRGSS
jgi:signal transduction histidine kinase